MAMYMSRPTNSLFDAECRARIAAPAVSSADRPCLVSDSRAPGNFRCDRIVEVSTERKLNPLYDSLVRQHAPQQKMSFDFAGLN